MTKPEDLWGDDFARKRKLVVAKKIKAKTQITPAMRREIIGMARTTLNGERQSFDYPCLGSTYNVLLVQAPSDMSNPFKFESGDFSVKFDWQGSKVGVALNKEQLEMIRPEEFYVIVGFLSNKGRYTNFYLRTIITLDQIADAGVKPIELPEEQAEAEPLEEEPVDLVSKEVTPTETL